jgi:ferredoxin-NADP reductase
MPLPPSFEARLVAARPLAPRVRELVFERLDGASMAFEAGQWIAVHLPLEGAGILGSRRSYSIASAPDGSSRFAIAVTLVPGGAGSTWLHRADTGSVLTFHGPQGFFTRPTAAPPPALFVATGTGLTPLRSMLHASVAAGADAPTWILLGVRHAEDILYGEELRAIAASRPSVRFEVTLSQPPAGWTGRTGYVQAHVKALWTELIAAANEPHAYVCGLHRMVGSVRDLLRREVGVPRERVHTERYD